MDSQNADSQYPAKPAGLPTSADHDGEQLRVNRELEEQIRKLSQEDFDQIIKVCKSIRQREISKESNLDHRLDAKEVLSFVKDSYEYLRELSINIRRTNAYSKDLGELRNQHPLYALTQFLGSVVQDPGSAPQKIQSAISEWSKPNSSLISRQGLGVLIDMNLERKKQILAVVRFLNQDYSKTQDLRQVNRNLAESEEAIRIIKEDLSDFRAELQSS